MWNKRYQDLSLDAQVLATKTSHQTPSQLPPSSSPLLLVLLMDTSGHGTAERYTLLLMSTIGRDAAGAVALGPVNLGPA